MNCEHLRRLEGAGNVAAATKRAAARHLQGCGDCREHVLGVLRARGVTEDNLAARVREQIAAAIEADRPIMVRIAE